MKNKKIALIQSIDEFEYFNKKFKNIIFFLLSENCLSYFLKKKIPFLKFQDLNLNPEIFNRNFKYYKKYINVIKNVDKQNIKINKINFNIATYYSHINRNYFFSCLNDIDILEGIFSKFRNYKIYIFINKYDDLDSLPYILRQFSRKHKNIISIESDKKIFNTKVKHHTNHQYFNIKFLNTTYIKSLFKILLFYNLGIFNLLFQKLTNFKYCKKLNLVFLDSINFIKFINIKNFFLIESFINLKNINQKRDKFKNRILLSNIFEKVNYFKYKNYKLDFFFKILFFKQIVNNFSIIEKAYYNISNSLKFRKINYVLSKYNQIPLQSLLFDKFQSNNTKLFTGYHGGAYNFYKKNPVMDIMSTHHFSPTYLCAHKEHADLLKSQVTKKVKIKIIKQPQKKNILIKNKYFKNKKNNFIYLMNDIGKDLNSENKLLNSLDDVSYLNLINTINTLFKYKNISLDFKLKDTRDKKLLISILKNESVIIDKKLNEVSDEYEYFIVSHYSSAIYELLKKRKKVIFLMFTNLSQINPVIYKSLAKNIIICKSLKYLEKIIFKIKTDKFKFNLDDKNLISFLNIYE